MVSVLGRGEQRVLSQFWLARLHIVPHLSGKLPGYLTERRGVCRY